MAAPSIIPDDAITSDASYLRLAQTIPLTEAEGPGKRFAIWFQGCPLRCNGCCNPEMLQFNGGYEQTTESLIDDILQSRTDNGIEGVTLIGGEPFAHARGAATLAEHVRKVGLTVMIFSGFTIEELKDTEDEAVHRLLAECDLLVDGRYEKELPDVERRWIGSRNQRVHFLSERYQPDDARWTSRDTLEIRIENGEILINGFPAPDAKELWQRLAKRT